MGKSFKKTIGVLLAIAVSVGLLFGGMQLWAPDNYKPSNWGKGATQTEAFAQDSAQEEGASVASLSATTTAYADEIAVQADADDFDFKDYVNDYIEALNAQEDGFRYSLTSTQSVWNNNVLNNLYVKYEFSGNVYALTQVSDADGFALIRKYEILAMDKDGVVTHSETKDYILLFDRRNFSNDIARDDWSILSVDFTYKFGNDGYYDFSADWYLSAKTVDTVNVIGYIFGHPTAFENEEICFNLKLGQVVPLPEAPEKEHYTFAGWYYDEAFTKPYNGEVIYKNTVLYAKYDIDTFSITFKCDKANLNDICEIVEWNSFIPLTVLHTVADELVKRAGADIYIFKGWYLPDGTEYTNQPIEKDTVLTAVLETRVFTVTFKVDGEILTTITVESGTSFAYLVKKARGMNYAVDSLYADGVLIDGDDIVTFSVTSDNVVVELGEMSTGDKIAKWFEDNMWYLIGGACGVAALVVLGVVVARKKRNS